MLHGYVSQKGYGNALIVRYGGYFEEDIRRLTKRQVPRGGVYGGLVILAHP